ncbi:MAG: hypothetical protein ACRD3N_00645 [Terracidiphilus sp.]
MSIYCFTIGRRRASAGEFGQSHPGGKNKDPARVEHQEAARLFNLRRDHGIECGPVDIMVCAAAIRLGYEILTCDRGMLRCVEALRAEGFRL